MVNRRQSIVFTAAMSALLVSGLARADATLEQAQQFLKGKSVRVIVPYAPGGSTDAIARRLALELSREFQANAIVDNRPGGNSIIAVQALLTAPSDGLSLLVSEGIPITVNPKIFHKLPYSPENDLLPVGTLASFPMVAVANMQLPYTNLIELADAIKSSPGTIKQASAGIGTLDHMAGGLFAQVAGVELANIPYKGAAPALSDLMAGHIQVMFTDLPSGLPYIKAGKVKALATTGEARSAQLPDVPTGGEAFPGYAFSGVFAAYAHGDTEAHTAELLNTAINQVGRLDSMKEFLNERNFTAFSSNLDEHRAFLNKEVDMYSTVIDSLQLPMN